MEAGQGAVYSAVLVLLARILRYKIIVHHHSSSYLRLKSALHRLAVCFSGPRCIHVVLGNQMREEFLREFNVRPQCVAISSNATYFAGAQRTKCQHPGEKVILGLLSNLSAEKGLGEAIKIALLCVSRGLDISLLLAGPVSEKDEYLIRDAKILLGNRLEMVGPVHSAEKWRFFERINVFLFPSTYKNEAQPLVLLEAMSCGIPIVTSDNGYIRELIDDAGLVLHMNEDFSKQAVDFIQSLVSNPRKFVECSNKSIGRYRALLDQSNEQKASLINSIVR